MDIIKSLTMSKRQLKKVKPLDLTTRGPLSCTCDEAIILSGRRNRFFSGYKDVHLVLFKDGEPIIRFKTDSDVLDIEPSNLTLSIDIASKNSSVRLWSFRGELLIGWDGVKLHITGQTNETV